MEQKEEFEKITTWKPGMGWDVALEEMRRRKEAAKRMGGKERIERHHSQSTDNPVLRRRLELLGAVEHLICLRTASAVPRQRPE